VKIGNTKGLYQKARNGEIDNFTGIFHPYQEPKKPDLDLPTHQVPTKELVKKIIKYLKSQKLIP
jgi:adenylylsulfate kinase